jgi:lantibiotic modifying enzyme
MTTLQNTIGATAYPSASGQCASWRLPEPLREQALQRVRHVCAHLARQRRELKVPEASFSQGVAPAALLLASAGQVFGVDDYSAVAFELMDHAVANMNHDSPSLYRGVPGVLWCALNLDRVCDTDEYGAIANDVDEALLDILAPENTWSGHFDLISGVAGIGVYVLERHGASRFPNLVGAVVENLERLSARDADGRYWPTTRKNHIGTWKGGDQDSYADIGMAHGSAGVVALFSALIEAGAPAGRILPLLDSATAWLLAQRTGNEETGVYPYTVGNRAPTRGAWCYGDFSSANALLLASRALERPDLGADALALLSGAARRTDASLKIEDAWICHGHAGLAHLLRRASEQLEDPALGEHALRFYRSALAAPSQAAVPSQYVPFYLEGDIGNSLCYLDACGLLSYRWDRPCLFS